MGSKQARSSLEGLSVGDAFGERFFRPPEIARMLVAERAVPASPWRWTDDTAMAISIVDVLERYQGIEPDALARAFAVRYAADPRRGYGGMAHEILSAIAAGAPWREAAGAAFGGEGSMGNGAAMRAAPIGAWFADDLDAVASHARRSAEPTHAHPEGAAGAIAIALGAALAPTLSGVALLRAVVERTPESRTRDGVLRASELAATTDATAAAELLGNGALVCAHDTVPFALFAAAHHLRDFEDALWFTVAGLGDRDTTCAIVGGIVALTAPIPDAFLAAREPLPELARR